MLTIIMLFDLFVAEWEEGPEDISKGEFLRGLLYVFLMDAVTVVGTTSLTLIYSGRM